MNVDRKKLWEQSKSWKKKGEVTRFIELVNKEYKRIKFKVN